MEREESLNGSMIIVWEVANNTFKRNVGKTKDVEKCVKKPT
jgi:hypothetical protein